MANSRFKLDQPTLAIRTLEDGRQMPLRIPGDNVVTLNGPLTDDQLVEAMWDGLTVLMFPQDIRDRGTPVSSAGD